MSEKLHIKNFGPIKEIDLEIKKITILIGEQGTGKSAIAKLLYVFNKREFVFAGNKEKEYLIELYGLFFKKNTEIYYSTKHYSISFSNGKFDVVFKEDKESENLKKIYDLSRPLSKRDELALKNWFNYRDWILKEGSEYMYVPAERIALLTTLRLIRETPNRNVYQSNFDQYILDFANDYDKASEKIKEFNIPHLKNVSYYKVNGIEKVAFNKDHLSLYQTSSGFQASIPMSVFFQYYTKGTKSNTKFIIEEPELNLFPIAQYELIKFFIERVNSSNSSIFITTHSPYVLTSCNNLLQAFITGHKRSLTNKAAQIIPKKCWLDPSQVSANMMVSGGKGIENIIDDEEKLIKAEKIDSVSGILNKEFDDLLNLEFAKK